MSETPAQALNLPGLDTQPSLAPEPKVAAPGRPRVKPMDRSQLVWRTVDVEHLIDPDHPARAIWALSGKLDLSGFYAPIQAVEGVAGREPWDPRLLVSLWVYAYSRGMSSAREIGRRCTYEPAFQWLCGLEAINYHTLSDFRVAHADALQELFVEVLGVLSAEGLVSLERVMHDGTKIKACASSDTFGREERLRRHLAAARQQVESLAQESKDEPSRQEAAQARAAAERQQRLRMALEQLEQIRQTKSQAAEKEAVRVSTTDPEARIMKQSDGGYAPSYNVQVSTEASHKIIVGVGVSQQASDYGQLIGAVQQVEQNLQAKPQQVVADGGFTSRENILAMAAQGIDFIGSLGEKPAQSPSALEPAGAAGRFSREAFKYDATADRYECPAGQSLKCVREDRRRTGVVHYYYRADKRLCQNCPWQAQCCPQNPKGREVIRSVDEPPVGEFRQKMQTFQAQEIYRQRAPVAEFPHAWIKDKLGLRQFSLRGLVKVGLEALWACLTYNIQQWIRLCWRPSLASAQS
jgi:transposase